MLIATPEERKLIQQVPVGCLVEHYKGKRMKVIAVARHSEDGTLYVVYQKLYNCPEAGDKAFIVRPLSSFLDIVIVDGKEVPRFSVVKHTCC